MANTLVKLLYTVVCVKWSLDIPKTSKDIMLPGSHDVFLLRDIPRHSAPMIYQAVSSRQQICLTFQHLSTHGVNAPLWRGISLQQAEERAKLPETDNPKFLISYCLTIIDFFTYYLARCLRKLKFIICQSCTPKASQVRRIICWLAEFRTPCNKGNKANNATEVGQARSGPNQSNHSNGILSLRFSYQCGTVWTLSSTAFCVETNWNQAAALLKRCSSHYVSIGIIGLVCHCHPLPLLCSTRSKHIKTTRPNLAPWIAQGVAVCRVCWIVLWCMTYSSFHKLCSDFCIRLYTPCANQITDRAAFVRDPAKQILAKAMDHGRTATSHNSMPLLWSSSLSRTEQRKVTASRPSMRRWS